MGLIGLIGVVAVLLWVGGRGVIRAIGHRSGGGGADSEVPTKEVVVAVLSNDRGRKRTVQSDWKARFWGSMAILTLWFRRSD